jgi:hypothetical protein
MPYITTICVFKRTVWFIRPEITGIKLGLFLKGQIYSKPLQHSFKQLEFAEERTEQYTLI